MGTTGNRNFLNLRARLGKKKDKNFFFLTREVTWLIGKLLFRGWMRMSSLNRRWGKTNQYFLIIMFKPAGDTSDGQSSSMDVFHLAVHRPGDVVSAFGGVLKQTPTCDWKTCDAVIFCLHKSCCQGRNTWAQVGVAQGLILVCSWEVCTHQLSHREGNPTVLLHQLLQLIVFNSKTKQ